MKLTLAQDHKFRTGVLGLAIAPDGSEVFITCANGGVYSVDPETGETETFDKQHTSFASGCELLPDGKTLISGGYDGVLLWHNTETGRCLRQVTAHKFWNWQLALSPDGKQLATTTGQYVPSDFKYEPSPETEPSVKVFDTANGHGVTTFSHTPPVMSCVFSPDGQHLAAANLMGEVRVWDMKSKAGSPPVAKWTSPDFTSWGTIKSHHYSGGIYGLAFSPDGEALIICGMGPINDPMAGNGKMTWQRWSWRKSEKIDQIKNAERGSGLMEALAWHPDGKHFVMAGRQAQGTWNAAVFGAEDGSLVTSIDSKQRITHVRFTPDGKTLFISGAIGQPHRKDDKWPDWGRVQIYNVEV